MGVMKGGSRRGSVPRSRALMVRFAASCMPRFPGTGEVRVPEATRAGESDAAGRLGRRKGGIGCMLIPLLYPELLEPASARGLVELLCSARGVVILVGSMRMPAVQPVSAPVFATLLAFGELASRLGLAGLLAVAAVAPVAALVDPRFVEIERSGRRATVFSIVLKRLLRADASAWRGGGEREWISGL